MYTKYQKYYDLQYPSYRTLYWSRSDIGSNSSKLLKIWKASMDGSGVRMVVSLHNADVDYASIFTLDYSQQLLYWINHNDSCYFNIESSSVDGFRRRTVHSTSSLGCHQDKQAMDYFKGAIYVYYKDNNMYYRHSHNIYKIMVEYTPKITRFSYIGQYVCQFSNLHSGIKVISPERQLQGNNYTLKAA